MIALVSQGLDTTQRQGYASALAGLWSGLASTLTRLDAIAADPEELDASTLERLPRLQYELHRASELTFGMAPPAGAQRAHAELRAALASARDVTAEVVDAIEYGGSAEAATLVHEWRGALFRVRLARHQLGARPAAPVQPPAEPVPFPWPALAAVALTVAGVLTFTAGAIVALWPLWAAGLALVAAGLFVYRP